MSKKREEGERKGEGERSYLMLVRGVLRAVVLKEAEVEDSAGGESQLSQPSSSVSSFVEAIEDCRALFKASPSDDGCRSTSQFLKSSSVSRSEAVVGGFDSVVGDSTITGRFRGGMDARFGVTCRCLKGATASSPTVACLRSSMNVQRPSRKSPTNCLPVFTKSSFVPLEAWARVCGLLTVVSPMTEFGGLLSLGPILIS